jgi:hypothetical protein
MIVIWPRRHRGPDLTGSWQELINFPKPKLSPEIQKALIGDTTNAIPLPQTRPNPSLPPHLNTHYKEQMGSSNSKTRRPTDFHRWAGLACEDCSDPARKVLRPSERGHPLAARDPRLQRAVYRTAVERQKAARPGRHLCGPGHPRVQAQQGHQQPRRHRHQGLPRPLLHVAHRHPRPDRPAHLAQQDGPGPGLRRHHLHQDQHPRHCQGGDRQCHLCVRGLLQPV